MAFTDDFTDDNGVLLHNHTPSGGTAWSLDRDGAYDWRVNTNAIMTTANGGGADRTVYSCDDQGSADHYTQFKDIRLAGDDENYACCRLVDYQNFICWYCAGVGAIGSRMAKMVANVKTDLVTVQGTVNDVIKITCEGNTLKFYIGVDQQEGDITEASHNTETTQGVVAGVSVSAPDFDDFEAGPMAAGGVTLEIDTSECEK